LANEFANKVTTKPYLGNPLYSTLDNQVKEPAEWALEQTTDTIGTSSPKARLLFFKSAKQKQVSTEDCTNGESNSINQRKLNY